MTVDLSRVKEVLIALKLQEAQKEENPDLGRILLEAEDAVATITMKFGPMRASNEVVTLRYWLSEALDFIVYANEIQDSKEDPEGYARDMLLENNIRAALSGEN